MQKEHFFRIYRFGADGPGSCGVMTAAKEKIFDGVMTYAAARRFMDEHASDERPVGFEVFNDIRNRWEDFGDRYHGGRKVYDKDGLLYVIDPDYMAMWRVEDCRWYVWEVVSDGREFVMSFGSMKEAASYIDCLHEMEDLSHSQRREYVVDPVNVN